MDSASALANVRKIIRGALERETRSPTIVQIFDHAINASINDLRQKFRDVRESGHTAIVWPKMPKITSGDMPDGDDVSLIAAAVVDERGYILALKVIPHTQSGDPRKKPRVHLQWHPPEPD